MVINSSNTNWTGIIYLQVYQRTNHPDGDIIYNIREWTIPKTDQYYITMRLDYTEIIYKIVLEHADGSQETLIDANTYINPNYKTFANFHAEQGDKLKLDLTEITPGATGDAGIQACIIW